MSRYAFIQRLASAYFCCYLIGLILKKQLLRWLLAINI
jgi:hypothetical protein